MRPPVERVRRGDTELAYRVLGAGDRVLLFVMGLGGRSADWGPWLPDELARDRRVVLLDNRGTGQSSTPPAPWSIAEMAADALAVLDAVGAERADLCGLSMGGMIAQEIALSAPGRVGKLVLMSTSAGGPIEPRSPEVLSAFFPAPGTPPDEIIRGALRLITGAGFAVAHADRIEALVELALREPTSKRAFSAQLRAVVEADRRERLGALAAPSLILHGDDDALITVDHGRELARLIPGAGLTELPGIGHLPPWEAPEATIAAVRGFLDV